MSCTTGSVDKCKSYLTSEGGKPCWFLTSIYNSLDEFHTLKSVCSLFKIDKEKLKEKCGQYGISPQKNEVGDWGLTRFDVRKLHNFLYYEDKKDVGNRKGNDPWA